MLDLLLKSIENIKASVYPWGSGEEMEETLLNLITSNSIAENDHTSIGVIGVNCVHSALDQSNEVVAVTRVTA